MCRPAVAFGTRRSPVHLGTTHRTCRYSLLPALPRSAWMGLQLVQAAQACLKPMSPRPFPASLRIRRPQRGVGRSPSAQRMALPPGLTKLSLKKKARQMPKLLPHAFLEQHQPLPRQLPHPVAQMHELFRRTLRSAQLTQRSGRCRTCRKSGMQTLLCNGRLQLAEGAAQFPSPPRTTTRQGRMSISMVPTTSSQPTIARQA